MSRKVKSSTSSTLAGTRILVGRARHQAGALSAELRQRGAEVIEIPFIEIRRPKSFQPLDAALKHLATYHWLILTSVNGVEAMWERMENLHLIRASGKLEGSNDREGHDREGHDLSRAVRRSTANPALAAGGRVRIAAIGPATKNAIEQRGAKVDIVPREYIAESVVRSLKNKVKGKRVLLVRAKVARDVIPRELRKAGAQVDVVEAYETVIPKSSRTRLWVALENPKKRPHVVTFTSSSTVRNFIELLRTRPAVRAVPTILRRKLAGILIASIGPVTSATVREFGLPVDIAAKEFTIPGLVQAIVSALRQNSR
ncbi:MAG TPA: uroporphyrinogen-III synthase [Candidatus Sulfotelmatobacter sp.]|jgi:uroporphyrinogen-III synthase